MKAKLIYIHPFLFGLYPVIFLYSQNINEYPERTILTPLLLALGFSALVFCMSKFLLKTLSAAAIVSSVIILICLSFGRFLTFYKDTEMRVGSHVISHELLGSIIGLVIIAATVYGVMRYKEKLATFNQVLLLFSLVLIVFPLISIVTFEAKTGRVLRPQKDEALYIKKDVANKNYPDIYYFIFDRYAAPKSLQEEYNFDNSKFYAFLKQKGFYIAEDASTNYPKTFLSLGSSLNFEYLDFLTEKTGGGASSDESIVTPYIRNNKVVKFLKEKGYTYINIGPVWTPTSTNPNADKNYIFKDGLYPSADEFTTGFLNQTIAAPIFKTIFTDKMAVSKDPYNNDHRKRVVYEMNAIKEVPQIPGPKFVFMHVLIPHDPFVFDKNCNPIAEDVVNKSNHQTNYLNQLTCANTLIKEMISGILQNSKTPPVIILQSDEGPFPMNVPLPPKQSWGIASTASLREKYPIMNAYLFPGKKDTQLYSSITPVNSFRVLFNTYFGTKYPLLPDKNYVFQDEENFYKFTDITDRLKEKEASE